MTTRPPDATHKCIVCGTWWRLNPPTEFQPEGSWSVLTPDIMGKCCDNEPMEWQIVAAEDLR